MNSDLSKVVNHSRLLTVLLFLLTNWHSVIYAHSPHDVIDASVISPTFARDQTIFVVISDRVYRSRDGGYTWKELINGLDTKSLYRNISLPANFDESQEVFLTTEGDGIFKSQDSGDSWSRINKGLGSLDIRINVPHPQFAKNRILLAAASSGGLYKSGNGGEDWIEVLDKDTVITAISFDTNWDNPFVYAGDNSGNIYVSTTDGDTWKQIRRIEDAGAVSVIAFPPSQKNYDTFVLGTEQRGVLEISGDAGVTTLFNIGGATGQAIESIAFSPDYEEDQTVFVSTWHQIYRSNDKGKTWEKLSHGLTKNRQADSKRYKSAHFRDIRLSGNYLKDRTVYVGGFDGLFKSTDGGDTFVQLEMLPVGMIRRLAMAVSNGDSLSLIVSTYGGGIYISEDEGKSWGIKNKGVSVPRPGGIAFSPGYTTDNTIVAAIRGYLLRSQDRGDNWQSSKLHAMPAWQNSLYWYLRKLNVPDTWIDGLLTDAAKSDPMATKIVMSPDFQSDKTLYFGTRWHGIYKSFDGGQTAEAIWMPENKTLPVSDLAISNGYSSDETLFAGFRGGGVFKSVDSGRSWAPINNGLHFLDLWKAGIKHQLAQYDISLAISPDYTNDQTIYLGSSEGLHISENGGKTWNKLDVLADYEHDNIIALAISPDFKTEGSVIVSIRGRGLFVSDDRGRTFTAIGRELLSENHAIELIEFSPRVSMDKTILAASDEQVFISKNKGETWKRLLRPVRYENVRDAVRYTGNWRIIESIQHSALSVSSSVEKSDSVSLDFVGSGVTLIGPRAGDLGTAAIEIDGVHRETVDQYSDNDEFMSELFSVEGLEFGHHNITVTVTGSSNQNSEGTAVNIDAFDIVPK